MIYKFPSPVADRRLVSIVCPAYCEEEALPLFHAALAKAIRPLEQQYRFEVIYIDDGSHDRTVEAMRAIASRDPRVRWYSLSRNFGHQAALTAGLERASGDAVISMDADLQHPPELIGELLAKWEAGYEVVVTIRDDDQSLHVLKRWTSWAFYWLLAKVESGSATSGSAPPGAADFRLLARRPLAALLGMKESHRCLRGMVHWMGFRSIQIPYAPGKRVAGSTKYSLAKMVRLGSDGIVSSSLTPVRWIGAAGIASVTFAALLLAGFVAAWLGGVAFAPLLAAILVSQFALGGLILGALSIVGEYAGRAFHQVQSRPLYIIAESSETPLMDHSKAA
jgi:hypothetical protein